MYTTLAFLVLSTAAWTASASANPGDGHRGHGLPSPVTDADFRHDGAPPAAEVRLGRLLYFDKLISGNRNISCATCHHPSLATGDGLALPLGEGARGLGPDRRAGRTTTDAVHGRVPRNSPPLYNLGAREYTRMFDDGRVEADPAGHYAGGFLTPARWKLPGGLESALAAQAMFPVTAPTEMAGQAGENDVAEARRLGNVAGQDGVWELLAGRLAAVPEYVELFREAFPDEVRGPGDITFVLAANAIAAFEAVAFRADQSPFDRFLRGEAVLGEAASRGMRLFYGRAGCADCHSGKFQTDHEFHAIAMPQVGPGKGDGSDAAYWRATGLEAFVEDFGRGRVTARVEDRYAFRTPSLRNVAETGPWGHDGAYTSLEAVVRHHLDPVGSLERYRAPEDLLVPLDTILETTVSSWSRLGQEPLSSRRLAGFLERDAFVQTEDVLREKIAAANELAPRPLADTEVADLIAFLRSLTDAASLDLSHLVPGRVPSGLPVAD